MSARAESSLRLGARQRAMLEEMGVRVWLPQQEGQADDNCGGTEIAPPPKAEREPRLPGNSLLVEASTPEQAENHSLPRPVKAAAVAPAAQPLPIVIDAAMDLAALRAAAALCQACPLCAGRQHTVWDAVPVPLADQGQRWLFVLDAPSAEENAAGCPVQGEAGQLLTNMATAVGLLPQQVYRSHATKCAPAAGQRGGVAE